MRLRRHVENSLSALDHQVGRGVIPTLRVDENWIPQCAGNETLD
jgi:hypothetical protein